MTGSPVDGACGHRRSGRILHRCRRRPFRLESAGPPIAAAHVPRASPTGTCATRGYAVSRGTRTCLSRRPLISCRGPGGAAGRAGGRPGESRDRRGALRTADPAGSAGRPDPPHGPTAHPRAAPGRPEDPRVRRPGGARRAARRRGADVPRADLVGPRRRRPGRSPARGHRSDARAEVSARCLRPHAGVGTGRCGGPRWLALCSRSRIHGRGHRWSRCCAG